MRALEEALRAQSALVEACARRAVASRDPRLCSAWIGAVVRLMDASAATGSAIADIRWAPAGATLFQLPVRLRLPGLPPLPEGEGGSPPPDFRKTTSGGFANEFSGLKHSLPNETCALLSSPACGGGAECERSEHKAEGGEARVPPPSRYARHLPRERGRIVRLKSKGGAPRGNRNAQKSGCHSAAFRQFRRELALYVRTLKAELALISRADAAPTRAHFLRGRYAGALLRPRAPQLSARGGVCRRSSAGGRRW